MVIILTPEEEDGKPYLVLIVQPGASTPYYYSADNLHTTTQDTVQVTTQDSESARIEKLLEYCSVPRTRSEMQEFLGLKNREYFRKSILIPLLESGKIKLTIPEKPTSKNQKYVKS